MIPVRLKHAIYSRKIRKALNRKENSRENVNRKIGIITDAADGESIQKLVKLSGELGFKKEELKLVVLGANFEVSGMVKVIKLDTREVSASGKFRSQEILDFLAEEFELLVCYFSNKQELASLLAAEARSGMVFGNAPDNFGLYQVEVHAADLDIFQQEIKKYYRIFKRE
ncbi:hypothetical protein GCM10023115_39760 [Pontixanthobacter gangjinensis]